MTFPTFDLTGKVALVTGSSRGIGRAMALGLAHYGADVVIVSRSYDDCREAASEIQQKGRRALSVQCDVTKKNDVEELVCKAVKEFGKIDILISNAGMNIRKLMVDYAEEDWDKVLDTNLKGIFLAGQAVAKQMMAQGCGKIINISSILGGIGLPNQCAYASSKGGINQLTKVMALELAPYNINVNAIAPAYIKTPMVEAWLSDPARYKDIVSSTALERVGETDDLIGPVVFLASDASNYITGHILYVDGGWTAK
ncbi:MAG: SDR family NAD(P)-dependent oxidoreductase [Desulfocucumaceae bacterium]